MDLATSVIRCDGCEIGYTEWGADHARAADAVLAWHGLDPECRRMQGMARHLARRYRVICPETIRRRGSPLRAGPDDEGRLLLFARVAVSLADQLGLDRLHWLGTSTGGIVGVVAAGAGLRDRVRRLVLHDAEPIASTPTRRLIGDGGPRFWSAWDRLDVPVLCLRGPQSTRWTPDVVERMRTRGPRAVVVDLPDRAREPVTEAPVECAVIERFFDADRV